jgi:hypothetical protein
VIRVGPVPTWLPVSVPSHPEPNLSPDSEASGTLAEGVDSGEGESTSVPPQVVRRRIKTEPVAIDLGRWTVEELQICEMGSHGPENEYVCVGRIKLC